MRWIQLCQELQWRTSGSHWSSWSLHLQKILLSKTALVTCFKIRLLPLYLLKLFKWNYVIFAWFCLVWSIEKSFFVILDYAEFLLDSLLSVNLSSKGFFEYVPQTLLSTNAELRNKDSKRHHQHPHLFGSSQRLLYQWLPGDISFFFLLVEKCE